MDEQTREILTKISIVLREIETHYPELQKYLDETSNTIPHSEVSTENISNEELKNYLEGLEKMIVEYKKRH